MDSLFARSVSIPSASPPAEGMSWGPQALDEVLMEVGEALVDEPGRVRELLVALEGALATHAASIGEAEVFVDPVFETDHHQRRLSRLRKRYLAHGEEALRLHYAEQLTHARVLRLVTRIERTLSEEHDLILDGVWTDLGEVD